jgi:hypothetical protein
MVSRVRPKPVRSLNVPADELKVDEELLRSAKRTLRKLAAANKAKPPGWTPPESSAARPAPSAPTVPGDPASTPAPVIASGQLAPVSPGAGVPGAVVQGTVVAPDVAGAPALIVPPAPTITGATLPMTGTAQPVVVNPGLPGATLPGSGQPTVPVPGQPAGPATTTNLPLPGDGAHIAIPKTEIPVIDGLVTPAYVKLKGELQKLLDSEIFSTRDITLSDVKIGEYSGVSIKTHLQILPDTDPLIANDPVRSASIARARASGTPETWALTGGGVFPSVNVGATIPTGAGPDITLGFSAGVGINYAVLAPYPHDATLTLDVVKNNSVGLPFGANSATALKPGTEVNFSGSGNAAANVGTNIGKKLSASYGGATLTAGLWADVGLSVATDAQLSFRVKRLDENKVFVAVSQGYDIVGKVTAGVTAGADIELPANLPSNVIGGGLLGPTATKLLGGVKGLSPQDLANQVNKVMKIDIRAEAAQQKSSREIQSYVFDLSKPEARAAYEKMMLLDFRDADRQVEATRAGADTGVKAAHYVEQFKSNSESVKATLFTLKALNAVQKRSTTHGVLETSQGRFEYDRADLEKSYSGLITNFFKGSRETNRALVMLKRPTGEVDNYFHFRSAITSDYVTSQADMRQFLAISELAGGANAATTALRNDSKLLKAFGTTDRIIDLYIADEGIERLSQMSTVELEDAYALYLRSKTKEETPSKPVENWTGAAPWADRDHPRYGMIMECLTTTDGGSGSGLELNSEYQAATGGRSLQSDSIDYRDCLKWVQLVQKLQSAKSPQQRAKMLVDAHKKLGHGVDMIGALTAAVGPQNVLVNEMSVKDTSRKLEVVIAREGEIQDPRAIIDTLINNPT